MLKLAAALLMAGATAASAQQPYAFTPLGYQQLTSISASTGLTIPTGTAPKIVEVCVSTQGIRYRDDGTAPTSSVGIPVAAGVCFQYSSNDLTQIKFIQQTSGAVVDVSYYR